MLVVLFIMGSGVYIAAIWGDLRYAGLSFAVFGILIMLLFYRLKVEVGDSHICLTFGIGLIHRSIIRTDVVAAEAVRNLFWYGWGIRYTPNGWMWNIYGLDAVEITYTSSKKFRIGTDEPEQLIQALGY
ncbi:MAG: hypothetical protein QF392_03825 [Candidatus Poseidoniia archaeon]|nr:hypothetical protein [Candidatus Poseidoniia archaeon]